MNYIQTGSKKLSSMTIGTVQLGMNYGIANDGGKPDEAKSFSMLRAAFENGITSLDTARAYGNSEEVIGRFLKTWEGEIPYITTKVPQHSGKDSGISLEQHVIQSVETSLESLGVKKVNAVMLHNVADMYAYGNEIADVMQGLITRGYTDQVGVSGYVKEDVMEMLKYPQYNVTQMPMSIFDQRLIASGATMDLKNAGYTVFVRSVFLQGLFFLDPDKIDDPILVEHAAPKIRILREIAKAEGMSIAQLAIAFMRDTAGVTSLVLGADTPDQVRENIAYFDAPALDKKVMERLQKEFAFVDIPEIMKVLSRPKAQK